MVQVKIVSYVWDEIDGVDITISLSPFEQMSIKNYIEQYFENPEIFISKVKNSNNTLFQFDIKNF